MNHEFEWRNEMRKLGGPVDPARDLWPQIAARLDAAPPATLPVRRRYTGWIALAATLVAALGAGFLALDHPQSRPATAPATPASNTATTPAAATPATGTSDAAKTPRTALDWAVPADPALVASAQHLDSASAQLQDALEQRPDAVFLVGLLNRTNAMRLRLMRKSPY